MTKKQLKNLIVELIAPDRYGKRAGRTYLMEVIKLNYPKKK